MLRGKTNELFELIQLIKYDKENLNEYRRIEKYYEVMNKIGEFNNLNEFIVCLTSIPVNEYIRIGEDGEAYPILLDKNGELNEYWSDWYINLGTKREVDDKRFNEFRKKCFELEQYNVGLGELLYRETRLFIINNPILDNIDKVNLELRKNGVTKISHRNIAKEYIEQCYFIINENKEFYICETCGYPKYINNKEASHNLCNAKYIKKNIAKGSVIARYEIYNDIIKPGRFEKLCFSRLSKEGFETILFPEIEREGDILVTINNTKYYLDMKAYNQAGDLAKELMLEGSEWNIKNKYKNRWIIVPDIFYIEQRECLEGILNKNGSRIYNIDDVINKLRREEKKC